MPLNWMDVSDVPFNALLLLERAQIGWLPLCFRDTAALSAALKANPAVEWFLRHKCPDINGWLDQALRAAPEHLTPEEIRQAERTSLAAIEDFIVYALNPSIYDAQPFLAWDTRELTSLVDFSGKTVIDVGAGTGRLALAAAETARAVFAVEPVENLRVYLKRKARRLGFGNVYCLDGLITDLPFPDHFADVVMSGHVFGDEPEAECREMERTARPGGLVIFCPGNNDVDNAAHQCLVSAGYQWSSFEEPRDGMKRKYWKVTAG